MVSREKRSHRSPAGRARPVRKPRQGAGRDRGRAGHRRRRRRCARPRKKSRWMQRLRATPAHPYVSRGGVKLAAALDHFDFDPQGRVCLDVGASTGGFTQVLLERGAKRVYAVDVGRGQLHESLRARPEVVSLEETDIRTLLPCPLRASRRIWSPSMSASFRSSWCCRPRLRWSHIAAQLVALIKPQFEAGRAAGQERHRARLRRARRGLRRHLGLRRLARLARARHHPLADRRRRRQCRIPARSRA